MIAPMKFALPFAAVAALLAAMPAPAQEVLDRAASTPAVETVPPPATLPAPAAPTAPAARISAAVIIITDALDDFVSSLEAGASAVLMLLSLWVSAVSSTVNSVSAVPDFETMEIEYSYL